MPNAPLVLNRNDASALGVFCSAISSLVYNGSPLDSSSVHRSLLLLAHLVRPACPEDAVPAPPTTWRGWMLPLQHMDGSLLLIEDGRQQVQLHLDGSEQILLGTWTDLSRHVVLSVQDGRLQIDSLTQLKELEPTRGVFRSPLPREPEPTWGLHSLAGAHKGRSFSLSVRTRIGRSLDNDIILSDNSVSRCHAIVERTATGFRLIDNQSLHGILVNGARVEDAVPLRPGDRIKILESEFLFDSDQCNNSTLSDPNRRMTIKIETPSLRPH